jgi:hypothetical protein
MQLNEGELITCPFCTYIGAVDLNFKRVRLTTKFTCPKCKRSFIAFRNLRAFSIQYVLPNEDKLDEQPIWKQIFSVEPVIRKQQGSSKIE